jgi:hypothetical protein
VEWVGCVFGGREGGRNSGVYRVLVGGEGMG